MDDRVPYEPEGAALSADMDLRLDDFLPHRLDVLAEILNQAMSDLVQRRFGLALPEWRVLVTLGQHQGITAKEIGTAARMHKTKVSRAVAGLEEKGYLARQLNRADLREAFLSLTPRGRKVYLQITPVALRFARQLNQALDAGEVPALDSLISRLTERAEKLSREIAERV